MLNMLIKKFKNILIIILIGLIIVNFGYNSKSYANDDGLNCNNPQIIIRIGEFGNESNVKMGKRKYVDKNFKTPSDIPLRKDDKGYFISEFDINVKLGTRIAQLVSKKGIKVDLQISSNKEEDLNGAGRWAKSKNPDIYLSVHHNAYKDNSEGYFFMVNDKDCVSDKYAKQLSDAIVNNPLGIPQMKNRINDGYIGEINEFRDTDTITILGEFGFFSSEKELIKIINDEQVEYVANQIADQLENILNSL